MSREVPVWIHHPAVPSLWSAVVSRFSHTNVVVAIVVAGFSFIYSRAWLRRHRVTPLRCEVQARDITFHGPLDRVTVIEPRRLSPGSDFEVPMSSPVEPIVRAMPIKGQIVIGCGDGELGC